jgi:hypothetical protein
MGKVHRWIWEVNGVTAYGNAVCAMTIGEADMNFVYLLLVVKQ